MISSYPQTMVYCNKYRLKFILQQLQTSVGIRFMGNYLRLQVPFSMRTGWPQLILPSGQCPVTAQVGP